jgi:hypothetical protein
MRKRDVGIETNCVQDLAFNVEDSVAEPFVEALGLGAGVDLERGSEGHASR